MTLHATAAGEGGLSREKEGVLTGIPKFIREAQNWGKCPTQRGVAPHNHRSQCMQLNSDLPGQSRLMQSWHSICVADVFHLKADKECCRMSLQL